MPNPYKGLLSPTFDANATNFIQESYYANDAQYRAAADAAAQSWKKEGANYLPAENGDSYSDWAVSCVEVGSFLPCGKTAGEVAVGDELQLADEVSLELGIGQVTYSKRQTVRN